MIQKEYIDHLNDSITKFKNAINRIEANYTNREHYSIIHKFRISKYKMYVDEMETELNTLTSKTSHE